MIPKVIHYCWFGRNPIPQELQKYVDSWKRVMPDYEIKLWNEDNYDITKCAYMKEAYEARKWAFVSDYARIDICYTFGGIYLDTDVEVLKKFDNLLSLEGFCSFDCDRSGKKTYVAFGLGFGCISGQKTLGILRDVYHGLHFKNLDGSLDLTTTPRIVTRKLVTLGLKRINEKQNIDGLVIFPIEYFSPLNQFTGELNVTHNTYSIHHYTATWKSSADQERRKLRGKYRYFGKLGAEIISSFIAYKKHYGMLRMWKNILEKIVERIKRRIIGI